ncbi:MAG: Maf family protein [Cetobacterium sp.]|uniref:Maf family protein n=1 Tax=Cetobacterium TaxID=180162 RepID=UPI001F06BF32|nr:Maf family protein [Cetobacterium somerae]MCX3066410.1 Maf family protein [Cetobacterium somerae]UPO98103.1 Maf family protein [Cetobacterium somerae]
MILASKSPRRKEILAQLGFQLQIKSKDIEEISDKIEIVEQIKDISLKKVMAVAVENPKDFVVGADTVVVIDGKILGKPKNEMDAEKMLKSLSGKSHEVITAYTLINLEKNIKITNSVESTVYFKPISDEEIKWYIESGEPMDKAGAYGIQGLGSIFVDKIDGDFFAIMGFPINHFIKTLNNLKIPIESLNKI